MLPGYNEALLEEKPNKMAPMVISEEEKGTAAQLQEGHYVELKTDDRSSLSAAPPVFNPPMPVPLIKK